MADRLTSERRSWNMARIRGRDTAPERQLRSLLHRSGLRFRLHARYLPGRPDIVLPKYRTAIFVHGCFWHRHQQCKNATIPSTRTAFWQEKFSSNVLRDARNLAALRDADWKVAVVWECELEADPPSVLKRLIRVLQADA